MLLDKGADINVQGGEHGTALQAAAYWGGEDVVQILLRQGADMNASVSTMCSLPWHDGVCASSTPCLLRAWLTGFPTKSLPLPKHFKYMETADTRLPS